MIIFAENIISTSRTMPGEFLMIPPGDRAKEERKEYKTRPTKAKWIQEVTSSPSFKPGAFTAEAVQHGMTARQFKEEVLRNPEKYSITTRRRAQFIHNIGV